MTSQLSEVENSNYNFIKKLQCLNETDGKRVQK